MWPFQAKQRVFNFLICTAYSCLYHSTPRQLLKQLLDGIPGYHASQVLLARYMPGGLQFQRLGFSSRLKSPCQQRWRQQVCWSKPMAWITHATATGLPHGFLRLFWQISKPLWFLVNSWRHRQLKALLTLKAWSCECVFSQWIPTYVCVHQIYYCNRSLLHNIVCQKCQNPVLGSFPAPRTERRWVLRLLELLGHPGGCLPVAPRGHLRSHDFGQGVSVPCRGDPLGYGSFMKFWGVPRLGWWGWWYEPKIVGFCPGITRYNPVTKVILDDSHRSWRHLLGDHPRLSRHCGQVCVEDGELVGGCNDLRCCPKLGSQFLMTSMNFKFWISNSNTSMMIWVSHQDFQRYVSGSHRSPEAKGKELTSIYDFFIGRREGAVVLERLLGFDAFSLHFLNSYI